MKTIRLTLRLPDKLAIQLVGMPNAESFVGHVLKEAIERMKMDGPVDPHEGTCYDEIFEGAVKLVLNERRGSITLIQRQFSIGYSRAARLINAMARMGILGSHVSATTREVLMTMEEWESRESKYSTSR